ncbi:ABC transporter ATP-binding protein, partial [Clostridium botulinum]|nr:ABC transporter ATP-binding protein [Clostridium botulinum]
AKVINEGSPLNNSKPANVSLEEAYVYMTVKEGI